MSIFYFDRKKFKKLQKVTATAAMLCTEITFSKLDVYEALLKQISLFFSFQFSDKNVFEGTCI